MKHNKSMKNYIVGEFNLTGINTIDVDAVVKDWNHLWGIYQYGADFRLIKGIRKDSELSGFKSTISAEQAGEIIDKANLKAEQSNFFTKAVTWKSQEG